MGMQGSKSVEVRPVGVSKVSTIHILQAMGGVILVLNLCLGNVQGAAMERILGEIVHQKPIQPPIDYVLCCGHFLSKVRLYPPLPHKC